jgi:uncharacterized protein YjbI with pentapeptide repeats
MAGDWRPCDQCGGACIADAASCLAHAEPEERAAALKQFSASGNFDLRGVTISDALLKEIFDTAPHLDRRPTFSAIQFGGATFEGDAGFVGATFKRNAWFGGTTFKDDAWFVKATFKGDARFSGATFEGNVPALGPVAVEGRLDLDRVQFTSAVRIDADASALTCRRARFSGGVRLDIRRATIRLDESDFSAPSLLTGPAAGSSVKMAGRPKLLSLNETNVAGLALGNVSLADCRFAGAHDLDKLRLEADAVFGLSQSSQGGSVARSSPRRLHGGRPTPGMAGRLRRGPTPKTSPRG